MFVDKVKVFIKAGDGGDGMVAFRREKFVPQGGPAGGDGGKGADVVLEVDEGLRTLMDFRYQKHFKAKRGENGRPKNQHGKNAEDLVVNVPPGTTIMDDDTGEVIADLTKHKERAVVAKGGRGGRGNTRFASPSNPAPELSEKGEPAEEKYITLELKLLADVGLVGFPSVGKSTLLSVVSSAKPKIADYHFTTINPNLGVVSAADGRSFVMADLPGLIEGAHEGIGLGHQFLQHIERTKVIVHVVDMSGLEGRDPYEDFKKINEELKQYNMRLLERPQIIMANKMDMPGAEDNLKVFKEKVPGEYEIFPVSALTKQGLKELILETADLVDNTSEFPLLEEQEQQERVVYRYERQQEPFTISRDDDGAFVLSGPEIEKAFKMTDMSRDDSVKRFSRKMRHMGIDDALREKGAKDGDTVRLLDFEFEFIE
ncbi:GTP-binding protein [Alteribacillus persepolensis]|uniref:GTPase Obg n=1 Tax=Alteribacillus persepolensis TaxID=568899 RepID=A0A1G8DG71_9BACI|nr:GTPase ObgE [Alteribacillus persepolensis]SDH56643.1 GTP-binding protein [Alteribacillus persepolensis]